MTDALCLFFCFAATRIKWVVEILKERFDEKEKAGKTERKENDGDWKKKIEKRFRKYDNP